MNGRKKGAWNLPRSPCTLSRMSPINMRFFATGEALEKIILKCIEIEPDKRYPYMSVVVRDLQQALYV